MVVFERTKRGWFYYQGIVFKYLFSYDLECSTQVRSAPTTGAVDTFGMCLIRRCSILETTVGIRARGHERVSSGNLVCNVGYQPGTCRNKNAKPPWGLIFAVMLWVGCRKESYLFELEGSLSAAANQAAPPNQSLVRLAT